MGQCINSIRWCDDHSHPWYVFLCSVQPLALVAKTTNLQKVQFAWHIMRSEDYEKQVKAKGDVKKFDFIHMIQVLGVCFVDI